MDRFRLSVILMVLSVLVGGNIKTAAAVTANQPRREQSVQEKMNICLAPIGGSIPLHSGAGEDLISSLGATKRLCEQGKLQQAMTCLEQVYNEYAEAMRNLHRHHNNVNLTLAVGKWTNSMEKLCSHIDYLLQHEDCTRVVAVETSHCIQRESQKFIEQSQKESVKALQRKQTGQKRLNLGCRFAQEIVYCFKTPLDNEQSCPCKYRQLMVDVAFDSIPSFCNIISDYYYFAVDADCYEDDNLDDLDGNPFDTAAVKVGARPGSGSYPLNPVVEIDRQSPHSWKGKQGKGGKIPGYKIQGSVQSQEHTGNGEPAAYRPWLSLVVVLSLMGVVYPLH